MNAFLLGFALATLATGGFVGFGMWLDRRRHPADTICSRVDQQLDQELMARNRLRVQRTVQAEPIPVVEHTTRGWVAR